MSTSIYLQPDESSRVLRVSAEMHGYKDAPLRINVRDQDYNLVGEFVLFLANDAYVAALRDAINGVSVPAAAALEETE